MPSRIFTLSESAYERGTEYDVVMLYQVLLGRNPENSTVIQNHRSQPLNATLHLFVSSDEFRTSVLTPIQTGGTVIRHDMGPRPSDDQLAWLFGRSVLDEGQKKTLREAPNWEQFFGYLCSLEGFLEQPPAPPLRAVRTPVPFKPNARPLIIPPPPISPPPATPPGPSNAELMARLAAMEAMLADILRLLRGQVHSAAADSPALADALPRDRLPGAAFEPTAAKAKAPSAAAKPSRSRQAR